MVKVHIWLFSLDHMCWSTPVFSLNSSFKFHMEGIGVGGKNIGKYAKNVVWRFSYMLLCLYTVSTYVQRIVWVYTQHSVFFVKFSDNLRWSYEEVRRNWNQYFSYIVQKIHTDMRICKEALSLWPPRYSTEVLARIISVVIFRWLWSLH